MDTKFYDKECNEISIENWSELFENYQYKLIALDMVGDLRVSTVWLGMDHNFLGDSDKPLIFETMVFQGKEGFDEVDAKRYATIDEAVEGHKEMVEKYK